jgi:hypothetical protein
MRTSLFASTVLFVCTVSANGMASSGRIFNFSSDEEVQSKKTTPNEHSNGEDDLSPAELTLTEKERTKLREQMKRSLSPAFIDALTALNTQSPPMSLTPQACDVLLGYDDPMDEEEWKAELAKNKDLLRASQDGKNKEGKDPLRDPRRP